MSEQNHKEIFENILKNYKNILDACVKKGGIFESSEQSYILHMDYETIKKVFKDIIDNIEKSKKVKEME